MPDTHLRALSNAQTIRESKGRSIIAFPDTYCVIDVETTGRSPQWDHIIEVAALKISDGQEVGRFSSLIQPPSMPGGNYIDEFIAALTGITDEMLESAPFAPDVLEEFASFVRDTPVVGHYVGFDINFLYDSFDRYLDRPFSNDYIDSLRIARKLHPEMPHHRLADLVDHFGVTHNDTHRAMGDVEATAECFARLKNEAFEHHGSEERFQELFGSVRKRRRSVPEGQDSVHEGFRVGGPGRHQPGRCHQDDSLSDPRQQRLLRERQRRQEQQTEEGRKVGPQGHGNRNPPRERFLRHARRGTPEGTLGAP